MRPQIDITDLEKLDIRIGTITTAEKVVGSDKLIKLNVDFGVEIGVRQILTGMQKFYEPEYFVGMQTIFCLNLKPRKMMGIESQGMIMALGLSDDSTPVFLVPRELVINGDGLR